jgi:hypothetical protein
MYKLLIICFVILLNLVINVSNVEAETLAERIEKYPHWTKQINLPSPDQDLIYPQWFEGKWTVTSKLVELLAPLSPDFISPGFDNNYNYINQNIKFQVKFVPSLSFAEINSFTPSLINKKQSSVIIADRQFNSLQITNAYLTYQLEDNNKLIKQIQVSINPNNSTEQITKFSEENELISTVIGRKQETLSERIFLTSELTRQLFRRPLNIYANLVETTTQYRFISHQKIQADQFTAIYLSPMDPDYFKAKNKPVALYHYNLNLAKK